MSRFGRMALCEAYFRHYRILTEELMTTLILKGANLPRFFLQVNLEIHARLMMIAHLQT